MHGHADETTLLTWLPLALVGLITLAYLMAARRQRRRGNGWSRWRSAFFVLGSLLLAQAVAPPVMAWAHHDLNGHMALHLVMGMLAPLAWVLAAPVTLLLRCGFAPYRCLAKELAGTRRIASAQRPAA